MEREDDIHYTLSDAIKEWYLTVIPGAMLVQSARDARSAQSKLEKMGIYSAGFAIEGVKVAIYYIGTSAIHDLFR